MRFASNVNVLSFTERDTSEILKWNQFCYTPEDGNLIGETCVEC